MGCLRDAQLDYELAVIFRKHMEMFLSIAFVDTYDDGLRGTA